MNRSTQIQRLAASLPEETARNTFEYAEKYLNGNLSLAASVTENIDLELLALIVGADIPRWDDDEPQ